MKALLTGLLLAALSLPASADNPLVGVWRIVGDKSGEAEALVQISDKGGVFEGRLVRIFPRPGVDPAARCSECPGARKDQPLLGLTILSGLRQEGSEYVGGEILDPDDGDVYRCRAKLSADRRQLHVRGYLGISLLGRTQTWTRE